MLLSERGWQAKAIDSHYQRPKLLSQKHTISHKMVESKTQPAQYKLIIITRKKKVKNPFSTAGGPALLCHMGE